MENNYFIPNIEDIHVGYECEIAVPTDINFEYFKWQPIILSKDNFNHETPDFALSAGIRTPYLTKEQIEDDGWILEYGKKVSLRGYQSEQEFKIAFTKGDYIINARALFYSSHYMEIYTKRGERIYQGECKDINTFRYICKLLGIK